MPRKSKLLEAQMEAEQHAQYRASENKRLFESAMRDLQMARERREKMMADNLEKEKEKQKQVQEKQKKEKKFSEEVGRSRIPVKTIQTSETSEYNLSNKFKFKPLSELIKIDKNELIRLHTLAKEGNVLAQFDIARCYEEGIHVNKKHSVSIAWYQKLLESGEYAPAQYNLARHYFHNPILKSTKNEQIGFTLLQKAAKAGHSMAQNYLANCYLKSIGVDPSADNLLFAYFWFKKAFESGEMKAKMGLDVCNALQISYDFNPEGLELTTPEQFVKQVEEMAVAKNVRFVYKDLEFFENNIVQFNKYKERALASQNSHKCAKEKFHIARCYIDGIHVEQNEQEGIKLFKKAAELNYAPAQYLLALLYCEGRVKEENNQSNAARATDQELAFKWMKKSAEAGYAIAQRNLAVYYKKNIGVPKGEENAAAAFHWLMKASILGEMTARKLIIWCIENQFGIPESYKRNIQNKPIKPTAVIENKNKKGMAPHFTAAIESASKPNILPNNEKQNGDAVPAAKQKAPDASDRKIASEPQAKNVVAEPNSAAEVVSSASVEIITSFKRRFGQGPGSDRVCESKKERELLSMHQKLRENGEQASIFTKNKKAASSTLTDNIDPKPSVANMQRGKTGEPLLKKQKR